MSAFRRVLHPGVTSVRPTPPGRIGIRAYLTGCHATRGRPPMKTESVAGVTRLTCVPSAFMTYVPRIGSGRLLERVAAICVPSGDQTGVARWGSPIAPHGRAVRGES